ncbi:MAG: hypothetical protein WDO73_29970 [Ignavibacteriota bacterium]
MRETVYPGSESTVNIKILIPRRRGKAAEEALDKGLADYQKGYEQNYKKAVEQFEKALQLDPTYSQAAYLPRPDSQRAIRGREGAAVLQEGGGDRSRL